MSSNEHDFDYEYPNDNGDLNDDEQVISEYYTNRRLQKNKMERKIRQTQMWLGRFRFLVRLMTIALLIFIGYKLIKLPYWYLNDSVFNSPNNKYLEILNNKIVPSYKILSALRRTDIPRTPIYRLNTDEIKNNIMQLDPVENVFIRRFWFPARLQIIIEECTPILSIAPTINVPTVAFFTSKGKLIGRDYLPLNKAYKTILVLTYGSKGDDYRNWNYEKIKLLENVAKAVNVNSKEPVEYIDVRNPKDVYVKIHTVNIRLGDLDDNVFERIGRISSILPQVKMLDKKIKYIDLRWKNTNYIKLG